MDREGERHSTHRHVQLRMTAARLTSLDHVPPRAPSSHTFTQASSAPSQPLSSSRSRWAGEIMSLPLHLRSYKEKSKDELSRDFFNVPTEEQLPGPGDPPSVVKIRNASGSSKKAEGPGNQGMEINAVLSVEGKEEVYVSNNLLHTYPISPHLPRHRGGRTCG